MVAVETAKKRKTTDPNAGKASKRKVAKTVAVSKEQVEELEDQISQSRKYYNNIASLLSLLGPSKDEDRRRRSGGKPECELVVAVSLCRVFCRLLSAGQLNRGAKEEQEQIVVEWLREKLQGYQDALILVLRSGPEPQQSAVLTLAMRLLKEQSTYMVGSETQVWSSGFFHHVVVALLQAEEGESVRAEFMRKFALKYHDVAIYMVTRIANHLSAERPASEVDNAISMLSQLGAPPSKDTEFDSFYTDLSKIGTKTASTFASVPAYKKKVQDAWLAVLRNKHDESRRKTLLRSMSRNIAPWFLKPELLMDFLTDSYNQGGAISLLALSGLFYLIQVRNLDYPQFYTKLYSLLDADFLHSKHRSRSFRLFETFLSSTHLPSTLIASFMKRLSRLALTAPPAAIVVIVPFIYNLLKAHPTCTFMLHREIPQPPPQQASSPVFTDPFDITEQDPSLTGAIDSSLWELESLQSHYHPNVASIARIVSEQFTKMSYNLEDFLDHSYQGLVQAELGRGLTEERPFRKVPVVEFQIPKRIFTNRMLEEDGGVDRERNAALRKLWDF